MSRAHDWLAHASLWLWPRVADHLWQATLFAAIVLAASWILRRGPARVRHTFWILASLKLIVPIAFLVWLAEQAGIDFLSLTTLVNQASEVPSLFQGFSEPVSTFASNYQVTVSSSQPVSHNELYCVLTLVWLLGSLSFLVLFGMRRRTFTCALTRGQALTQGREWQAFKRARAALGMGNSVELLTSPDKAEPTVGRIRKPVILLPSSMGEHLNDQELEAIMLHELVHVQRRDNLVGNLQMAVMALFWFHPLVWFIGRKLINERELACDERVLETGGTPEDYASSILKVVRFSFGWKVAGVSGVGNGSNLRRRIKNIMSSNNTKRSDTGSRLAAVTLLALGMILMVVTGVNTRADGANNAFKQETIAASYDTVVRAPHGDGQKTSVRRMPPPPPPAPEPNEAPPAPATPASPATPPAPPAPPARVSEASPATPATAPTAPTQERRSKTKSVDVEGGELIEAPQPVYPVEARKENITGTVNVDIVIGEDGKVASASASNGPQALRAAAVSAAYKARFKTAKVNGKPVKVSKGLSYDFVIQ